MIRAYEKNIQSISKYLQIFTCRSEGVNPNLKELKFDGCLLRMQDKKNGRPEKSTCSKWMIFQAPKQCEKIKKGGQI